MKFIIFFTITFSLSQIQTLAQIKGEDPEKGLKDTTFIFESPRPLVTYNPETSDVKSALGLDIFITERSGFGAGGFYQYFLTPSFSTYLHLAVSAKRNTDEFQQFNGQRFVVFNKINRLYRFPLMLAIQQDLFQNSLSDNFTPYITGGIGTTLVLSLPYTFNRQPNGEFLNFFEAWGEEPEWYNFPGGFIGFGANFGIVAETLFGVNIKYYYVPPGNVELASVVNNPIENFGGLFINISIGKYYYK